MNNEILDQEEIASIKERKENSRKIEGLIRLFYWGCCMYLVWFRGFSIEAVVGSLLAQLFVINHLLQGIRNIRGMEIRYSKWLTLSSLLGSLGIFAFVVYTAFNIKDANEFIIVKITAILTIMVCVIVFDIKLFFSKKEG
ncbi:MAG TPA: hypothetical protein VHO72_01170 [Bacteroidales bacterium]|nr:hypothetical protein [Bacteroidales bacterium]